MTSQASQAQGKFSLFVIDAGIDNPDPWKNPYLALPSFRRSITSSFPLIDIRPDISDPDYNPAAMIKSHGFGLVKHRSALLESPNVQQGFDNDQMLNETYHSEIKDLVMGATGANHVFVGQSFIRQSKAAASGDVKHPNSLHTSKFAATVNRQANTEDHKIQIPTSARSSPARIPHLDYTAFGTRQSIRSWRRDVQRMAVEKGIISAEDAICSSLPYPAASAEASTVIAEQYNRNGLGPRYAIYSIWRPLRTVHCDPLCMARWSENTGDLVSWPYNMRIPGHPDLGGDFLRELAFLGVQDESATQYGEINSGSLQWYYVSEQTPEEVYIIKLFDSAALGRNEEEAPAPWHGSPDIGRADGEEGRGSIETRVTAFW